MGRAGPDPVPVRVRAARRGLGALRDADGQRGAPDPGPRRDRDPQVLQRTRELHARQPVHHRRGARAAPASSSAPASTRSGIASAGGAGRALAEWIVEGEPTIDLISADLRRFSPLAGNDALAARAGRRGAGPPLRRAVAEPRAGDRRARSGARRCTTGSSRRAPASAAATTGSGPTSSPRKGSRRSSSTPGAGPPGWTGRSPSSAPPARPSRSSTRRRSPSTSWPGTDAEQALQWLCTADVAVPVGRAVYTAMLNARGTYEARPHRHPHRSPTSSSSSAVPRRPSATSTGSDATCRPGAHAQRRRRDRARMPCSA